MRQMRSAATPERIGRHHAVQIRIIIASERGSNHCAIITSIAVGV